MGGRSFVAVRLELRATANPMEAARKVAAILGAAALVLKLVPALLEPPAPQPLPADVGLPRVAAPEAPAADARPERDHGRARALERRRHKALLGRVVSGGGGRGRAESSEGKRRARHGKPSLSPKKSEAQAGYPHPATGPARHSHRPSRPTTRTGPTATCSSPRTCSRSSATTRRRLERVRSSLATWL